MTLAFFANHWHIKIAVDARVLFDWHVVAVNQTVLTLNEHDAKETFEIGVTFQRCFAENVRITWVLC